MGTAAARKRKPTKIHQTAVSKKFGRYKPENEKVVRKTAVKEDKVLESLKEAWKSFHFEIYGEDKSYPRALEHLRDLAYSKKDVEKFSVVLSEFQDEEDFPYKAGIFLSALINNGKDDDYTIHTAHLLESISSIGFKVEPIYYLGYKNRKNITVKGDAGTWLGWGMECGTITVEGNAAKRIGTWMTGGTIIVEGSANGKVGAWNLNGKIIIEGDAGGGVGIEMEGGEIHIKGEMWFHNEVYEHMKGGKIYYRGRLIVDK